MKNCDDIIIYKAAIKDLNDIRQLIHSTIEKCYTGVYPDRAVDFFKSFHSKQRVNQRAEDGTTIIALKNKTIIGTGSIIKNEILGVFVNPDFQNIGLGKKLMFELEKIAIDMGIKESELDVSLPSRRFYENLGYNIIKECSIDVGENQILEYWNAKKTLKKILILDYSVDNSETPAIKQWMSEDTLVVPLFIDTKESFPNDLVDQNFTHVIHTGSALSINDTAPFTARAESFIKKAKDKGISQMGICYGHQLICRSLVGKHAVRSSPNGFEAGWEEVEFTKKGSQMLNIRKKEKIWQHHFDEVIELPEDSVEIATNSHTRVQAYINYNLRLFGTQFHPEFDKKTGNHLFLKDRSLLEKYDFNVDEIIKKGPSIEAGKIFFNYFLNNL